MSDCLSRRRFVQVASGSCGLMTIISGLAAQSAAQSLPAQIPNTPSPGLDKGPPLDQELVRKVVGAAHRDLAAVKDLVNADQELANACWDWGGGDYETPMGAAAHTGQREIARFLLDHGARLDVFASAMLGMLEVVKAAIEADDTTRYALGPHGLTLMHHANAGGEQAAIVARYLDDLYRNDTTPRDISLSPRAVRRYIGRFAADSDSAQVFIFSETSRVLHWQVNDSPARALANRGNHVFAGAPGADFVTFEFVVRNNAAHTVAIAGRNKTVAAKRIAA